MSMTVNPKSNLQMTGEHAKSLRPPQFGLRTLMALVTACAGLLALGQWLDPIAIAAMAFLALSIFCHVAGNCIGTRLREIGDNRDLPRDDSPAKRVPARAQDFAPVTHLSRRRSLGWPIVIASSVGITCGAIGGGLWTFAVSRGDAGVLNIAVGIVAFGVLGGLAAFATVGFAQVLFGALWQALSTPPTTGPAGDQSR
jgi:hypothetical protein